MSLLFWLLVTAACTLPSPSAQVGTVLSERKISALEGGFAGGLDPADHFGQALAALGDLDGNGVGDLAVGASSDDDGGTSKGAVWILFLNADGTVASQQKISATQGGLVSPLQFGENFGLALAALGDQNGDGVGDLAVGGFRDALWILFLNPDGTVAAEQKIAEGTGGFGGNLDESDNFGLAVAALGDLDGNGFGDLAAGTPGDDDGGFGGTDRGAVWILFLGPGGSVIDERKISSTAGGFGGVLQQGDGFGIALSGLGDHDGDGVPDLAVGARLDEDGGNDQGAVWILFLEPDGTVASEQKISALAGGFGGTLEPTDLFGSSLAVLGDLDRDGIGDLAVGAFGDEEAGTDGAVWILFLEPDGTVASEQKISQVEGGFGGDLDALDFFGSAVAALPDLNGDGVGELAVGASWDDDGGTDKGALWLLFLEGCQRLDFETEDDFTTPLVNGQDVSTPPEFGNLVAITSSGANAGAAIFDSTPFGPNDPSQDRDLLVGRGNVLILQTEANTTQTFPGVFDRPNDDSDGGTLTFTFTSAVEPRSLALIDIDSRAAEASMVVLTDRHGNVRVHSIPPGWTGDLLVDGVGWRTLDLTTLAPQPGFASTATAIEDGGFQRDGVVALELRLGGSGALDELCWRPTAPATRSGPRTRGTSGVGLPPVPRTR